MRLFMVVASVAILHRSVAAPVLLKTRSSLSLMAGVLKMSRAMAARAGLVVKPACVHRHFNHSGLDYNLLCSFCHIIAG